MQHCLVNHAQCKLMLMPLASMEFAVAIVHYSASLVSVSEWSCSFWRAMHQNTCTYICECVTCVCHQINSLFHIVSIHNQGIFEKVVRILMQPDMQSLFKHISMCCELHRCATCNTNLSLSILFFPPSLSLRCTHPASQCFQTKHVQLGAHIHSKQFYGCIRMEL